MNSVVEVFRTNVREAYKADHIVTIVQQRFPGSKVNFDLEDHDNILRVEGNDICPKQVVQLLNKHHCICEVLE